MCLELFAHTGFQIQANVSSKPSVNNYVHLSYYSQYLSFLRAVWQSARPLSCQSWSHLTNLPAPDGLRGNKGSFPLPPSELKWHGRGTGASRRAIYTWHLLTKCARWPLDNAGSLTFSGLFSWQKGTNLSEFFGTPVEYLAVSWDVVVKRPPRLLHFHSHPSSFFSMLSACPAVPWESLLRLNHRFVLIALTRISCRFIWCAIFFVHTVHVSSDNHVLVCAVLLLLCYYMKEHNKSN